ncbi:MAG: hypothetical protein II894_03670, partial [Bacteroidales bacterium]|nr:hypothetical protein [Bacteroidales bacterium]
FRPGTIALSGREALHRRSVEGLQTAVDPPEAKGFLHRIEIPESIVVRWATAFHAHPTRFFCRVVDFKPLAKLVAGLYL